MTDKFFYWLYQRLERAHRNTKHTVVVHKSALWIRRPNGILEPLGSPAEKIEAEQGLQLKA
jgi:hypothetical protein